jgi:cyclophilin family peptidyl-prolyl cis-trans isomerase
MKSCVRYLSVQIITLGLLFSSENYLEPPKPKKETTTSKKEVKKTSAYLEKGEELKKKGKQLQAKALEVNRLKKQLQFMGHQKHHPAFGSTVAQYKKLVSQHEKEINEYKVQVGDLVGKMKRPFEKGSLSREEALLYGRQYLVLGKTTRMISVFKKVNADKGLAAAESSELAKAHNSLNEMDEATLVLQNALKQKLEFEKKSELQFMLAQNYFWLEKFKDSILILKELERFPETRTRASRFLISYTQAYAGYKTELGYRKKSKNLPRAEIKTNKGIVLLELFEDDAPNAVSNFIILAENKYFDRQKFHRVIPNFMAQGGDPNSKDSDPSNDGQGGPGYGIRTEISKRNHFRGVISYANAGKDTDGSQFFLTVIPTFWLNGKHAVFGRILEGVDVVDSLSKGDEINSVKILSKRDHPYQVKKL